MLGYNEVLTSEQFKNKVEDFVKEATQLIKSERKGSKKLDTMLESYKHWMRQIHIRQYQIVEILQEGSQWDSSYKNKVNKDIEKEALEMIQALQKLVKEKGYILQLVYTLTREEYYYRGQITGIGPRSYKRKVRVYTVMAHTEKKAIALVKSRSRYPLLDVCTQEIYSDKVENVTVKYSNETFTARFNSEFDSNVKSDLQATYYLKNLNCLI